MTKQDDNGADKKQEKPKKQERPRFVQRVWGANKCCGKPPV